MDQSKFKSLYAKTIAYDQTSKWYIIQIKTKNATN